MGNHRLIIGNGSGNLVDGGNGGNTIKDSGTNNTLVLHAAGRGFDDLYGAYWTNGDMLDVRNALGATDWNGSANMVGNYITTASANNGVDTNLLVSATSGGTGVAFVTLHGTTGVTEVMLLPHLKVS